MTYEVLFTGRDSWVTPIVYGLVDPREPERVRYVGSTITPVSRYGSHLAVCRARRSFNPRETWVLGLQEHGILPAMVVLERTDSALDLDALESVWTMRLRQEGQADLNKFLMSNGRAKRMRLA